MFTNIYDKAHLYISLLTVKILLVFWTSHI